MNARTALLTGAAFATLIVLGCISAASPEFKYHATTVAIVVLAVMSLSGVLAAMIAPLLDALIDPRLDLTEPADEFTTAHGIDAETIEAEAGDRFSGWTSRS